jgi:hypothetical protein
MAAYLPTRKCNRTISSGSGQWVNFENPRLTRSPVVIRYHSSQLRIQLCSWLLPFDNTCLRTHPNGLTQGFGAFSGVTLLYWRVFPIPIAESSDDFSSTGSSNTDVPRFLVVYGLSQHGFLRKPGNQFFTLMHSRQDNWDSLAPPADSSSTGPGINTFDISLMEEDPD